MIEFSSDRRRFLAGAAAVPWAAGLGTSIVAGEPEPTRDKSGGSGSLSAVISLGGRDYAFRESDGEDLGDFHGPGFVQRCIRVTRPDLPLTVFFRPDRDSPRTEVVFELGRLWGKANENAANLERYHVRIARANSVLAEVVVPKHWWFAAWRWQSTRRPLIRTPEFLIRAGALPPYGPALTGYCRSGAPVSYNVPMDTAGVYLAMPTAGDRPDIGYVTECQAEYLITQDRNALRSLLAQAEAAGSVPWHFRDERTGAPVDFYAHPTAHWYYMPLTGSYEYIRRTKTEWTVDDAHQPALAYVPYLLTGDPYYLEKLQFQGTHNIGWTPYHRDVQHLQVLNPGETRAFAWGLRTLAQLARVTPESPPRWLLPKSYWLRMLEDNRRFFHRQYVEDAKPPSKVFRAATRQDQVAAWQEVYLALALGMAVSLGYPEWREAYEWKIGSTIALTNGKSGWPRQWSTPYYYKPGKGANGRPCESWSELWAAYKADRANHVVEPFPNQTSWAQNNSFGYVIYTRAALALAAALGVDEARDCYRFVHQMADEGLRQHRAEMTYRWAITPS